MNTYISLLRGINVNGQRKIQMKDLAELYAILGFEKIVTYIQSGNVVFSSKLNTLSKISQLIEKGIEDKFGYVVPVKVIEQNELQKIISGNPFLKVKGMDISKLHITFLSSAPSKENLKKIISADDDNDKMVIAGKEIYILCPNGYGRTKLTNSFFENKLKTNATTRNWKTINTLLEIAGTAKGKK